MTANDTQTYATIRDDRATCLREAIERRVERHRAERLRDLQDAVSVTWTDGLPGIRRSPC